MMVPSHHAVKAEEFLWTWTELRACFGLQRVALRVASGGHSIPEETIRRRYDRGRRNLIELYLPLADQWAIFDNSTQPSQPVAESVDQQSSIVYDSEKWAFIQGDW
jgi:predicted ABC-type ATPase